MSTSHYQLPTVLDAFAGGLVGFSLGFHLAGATIVGGIERDAWAAETFLFNHPRSQNARQRCRASIR